LEGRSEAQGAVVGTKLYVFGGYERVADGSLDAFRDAQVYDLGTNTWQLKAPMPEAITHAAIVVDGATIWLLGGYLGDVPHLSTSHVWKYNTNTNTWSAGPSLPAPRAGGGAALLGRKLHFYGGALQLAGQNTVTDHSDHYVLDLGASNPRWTRAAALPNPRNHMAGLALNGKAYAIGGQHEGSEGTANQAQVDVYDPGSNTWKRAANMPSPKGHISASTFVVGRQIVMIGGSTNNDINGAPSADVLIFDPKANVWLRMPSLPEARKTPVAGMIGGNLVVATGLGSSDAWKALKPNTWEIGADLPDELFEVAGGIVGNNMYLVGAGNSATLAYDLSRNSWSSASALTQRDFVGSHHTAEVFNRKLYLFGGLGSAGKVQIYTPGSDSWKLGAAMPFAAGSSSSALIKGQMYVAGGIVGGGTTDRASRYNPSNNTWTSVAPMPQGRNHAAAATDGEKLYIFGGRVGGNTLTNGFDTLQIYNPATDTWQSSEDPGSSLGPLPQARGGMGRAVFYNGEFYVIGGETASGAGATADGVYNRVDIYNPKTNTWRRGVDMPTARHGIFPLLVGGRIYVASGGVKAGASSSDKLEIYNPDPR